MRAQFVAIAAAVGVLAMAAPAGLARADGLALLSVQDEIQLGQQSQAEVRKQTPTINDGSLNNYVGSVFRQLTRYAGGPKYPYSISVANYSEVNAFSLPGGPVWVHRGAIEAAANESQLAGVLAHEIGHIERRHVARQVTNQMVAGGLMVLLQQVLPRDRKGEIGQIAVGLAAQGAMLKFSRDDEREADFEGTRIMRQAGWDAHALADFLDVLRAKEGRDPSAVQVFLSNHPAPGERAAALRGSALPSGGRRDSDAFQQNRARLRSFGPAQRMSTRN